LLGNGPPRLTVDVCSTYFGHPDAVNRILHGPLPAPGRLRSLRALAA
jgi:hypothetical protein